MMAKIRDDQEIVTQFLLNTCGLHHRLNVEAVDALSRCADLASRHSKSTVDNEGDVIPMTTGSVAEFYIQPLLSCVGDHDVMFHLSDELAIPAGTAPPTDLPGEFQNRVDVFEIVDSEFPGYVYLVSSYLLTECIDDGKYNTVECERWYGTYEVEAQSHGPAIVTRWSYAKPPFLERVASESYSRDEVYCVRCLSWPPQAAAWPTRHRNYGWPDSATVDRVVINGCDVVRVAHRQCRRDEWMHHRQHRLSFSRAEIVLLNSWTPVQQIMYHMLRVFVKTERLTDSADYSETATHSNYRIKTLMLWACELKPRSRWTNDLNLVRLNVQLLHTLAVWLTDIRCPHYFVNKCNLFDYSDNWHCSPLLVASSGLLTTIYANVLSFVLRIFHGCLVTSVLVAN